MNAARWIESRGVRVWAEGDSLTLDGLDEITPELASEVVAYARQNKVLLLEELMGGFGPLARLCLGCGKPFKPSDENKVYCRAGCANTMRGVLR